MTATATSASRKRTSGLRTSQRTRNIWRASKLGGKTRPTNWSNIFRWYRGGWGRYSQVDPLSPGGQPHFDVNRVYRFMRPDVPFPGIDDDMVRQWSGNEFPYAANNPTNNTDRQGLRALRCRVFTLVSMDGPGDARRCIMGGTCVSAWNELDAGITGGTILIPNCFACPRYCTFRQWGGVVVWVARGTDFRCEPWTPVYGSGPAGPDVF